MESIKEVGDMEQWRDAVESLCQLFPRVALGMFAAAATPLLDIVNAPGFTIDVSGNSSIGKTAWLEICASVWGMPTKERGGLVKGWDATKVFMERYAALMAGLPLFFDESQLADPRYLARIVYSLTNGEGRGRGSLAGLRASGSWRTIVFSTGEHPLSEASQDQGLRARTLLLWGSPFGGPDQGDAVRQAAMVCRTNYGFGGPLIVQWLIEHRDEWPQLGADYHDTYAKLVALAQGSNFADRYAGYFATIVMGAEIAHRAWNLRGDFEPGIRALFRETLGEVEESDYGDRALDAVRSWAAANRAMFYGSHDTDHPPNKFFGAWAGGDDDLAIFVPALKEFLRSQALSYEKTMRTWREKGWLKVLVSGKHLTYPRRINGIQDRLATIRGEFVRIEDDE